MGSVSRDIYNLTDGKIKIGSLDNGSNGGKQNAIGTLTQAVSTYSTQGFRDTENNAFYDNQVRMRKAMAVASVFLPGEGIDAQKIGYQQCSLPKNQELLIESGVISNNARNSLDGFIANANQNSALVTANGKIVNITTPLTQNQVCELAAKGSFTMEVNGVKETISITSSNVSQTMAQAQNVLNEQNANKTLLGASGTTGITANLQQIQQRQISYLKNNSITGNFDGSIASSNKEINALNQRNSEIFKNMGVSNIDDFKILANNQRKSFNDLEKKVKDFQPGGKFYHLKENNPQLFEKVYKKKFGKSTDEIFSDFQKTKDNLKLIDEVEKNTKLVNQHTFYKQTGGKAKGSGRRGNAYGISVIAQEVMGQDMYHGAMFYKNGGKITVTAGKIGAKSIVSAGNMGIQATMGAVRGTSMVASRVVTGKWDNVINDKAKKIAEGSNKFKKDFNKKINGLSKEEKLLNRQNARIKRHDKLANNFNKGTAKIENRLSKMQSKLTSGRVKNNSLRGRLLNGRIKGANLRLGIRKHLGSFGKKFTSVTDTAKKFGKKVKNVITAPFNFLKRGFDTLLSPIKLLKKAATKVIIVAAGGIVVIELVSMAIILICGGISGFYSSLPFAKAADQLRNVNYIQYIVNSTSSDLAEDVKNVAEKEATWHYLTTSSVFVPSENYAWSKTISNARLNHIWATEEMNLAKEQRKELSGISANLLPIVGMLKYRFEGQDIRYENYLTAKAYVYYMYVLSHKTASVDYVSDESIQHNYNSLYIGNSTPYHYNWYYPNEPITRTGIETNCDNIYIHGYANIVGQGNISQVVAKGRATLDGALHKSVSTILGELNIAYGADQKANGLWTEIPYDDKGKCDNYDTQPYQLNCGTSSHDHERDDTPSWYCLYNQSTKKLNDVPAHKFGEGHSPILNSKDINGATCGCYKYTVKSGISVTSDKEEIKKSNSTAYHIEGSDCYHTENKGVYLITYECGDWRTPREVPIDEYNKNPNAYSSCPLSNCTGEEYDNNGIRDIQQKDSQEVKVWDCNQKHIFLNADGNIRYDIMSDVYDSTLICTMHVHDDSCSKQYFVPVTEGILMFETYTGEWQLCPKQTHEHKPWNSASDPGCYSTAYICKGHCGGHVEPLVNLQVDMSFEKLCEKDFFSECYFLSEESFKLNTLIYQNYQSYQQVWKKRFADWFKISAGDILDYFNPLSKDFYGLWGHAFGEATLRVDNAMQGIDQATTEDYALPYFKGWLETEVDPTTTELRVRPKQDNNGNYIFRDGIINELESLYGTWKDNYKLGVEIFAMEGFDVRFPSGYITALSSIQINDALDVIESNNPSLSEERLDFIELALRSVGQYYYSDYYSVSFPYNPKTNRHDAVYDTNCVNVMRPYDEGVNFGGGANNSLYIRDIMARYLLSQNKQLPSWIYGNKNLTTDNFQSSPTYNIYEAIQKSNYKNRLQGSSTFNYNYNKTPGDIIMKHDGTCMGIYLGYLSQDDLDACLEGYQTKTNATPSTYGTKNAKKTLNPAYYMVTLDKDKGGSYLQEISVSEFNTYKRFVFVD